MRIVHVLVGVITLPEGESYAQCACGLKAYGSEVSAAYDSYRKHVVTTFRADGLA